MAYKVKSTIRGGSKKSQVYKPGSSIDLSPEEAWKIRHALVDPPKQEPGTPEVPSEVLESIRNNPENPESGIEAFWKTQPDAFTRTEANKTAVEKSLESKRQKTVAQEKAQNVKKPAAPPAKPVVPPVTRPAPKK